MTKPWMDIGRYGSVGIELVLAIVVCGAIGHWLDDRGTFGGGAHEGVGHDYGMLGGGLLGLAVGVRGLVRAAQRMQKDIERAEANDPEGSRWTTDESWLHKSDDHRQDPPS
jgi:hypothetical protein